MKVVRPTESRVQKWLDNDVVVYLNAMVRVRALKSSLSVGGFL